MAYLRPASWLIALLGWALSGCSQGESPRNKALALPAAAEQPAAEVALGRSLFWDPILSGNRDVACATCHHPDFGYGDGRSVSVGAGGVGLGPARIASTPSPHLTRRNAMTVLDSTFNGIGKSGQAIDPLLAPMFWDNRAHSFEEQARGPITTLNEMRGSDFSETTIFPELVQRLGAVPAYAEQFSNVFPGSGITEQNIVTAIATFERTLLDRGSSYDRYLNGDDKALSAAALRGLAVFNNNSCANCHGGPMLSDFELHRTGVKTLPDGAQDLGDGSGRFRTPSLRNVMRTAPYMHNGSLATLDEVFDFYKHVDQSLDPELQGLDAPQGQDAEDVKAFLAAVSDGSFDTTVPDTVPSGLAPGGAIH